MSQVELGNALDVSQALVSLWENEIREPGPEHVAALQGLDEDVTPEPREPERDEGDSFGVWLLRERTAAGLSRAELSTAAGVSVPAIWNIETGRTQNPRDVTRRRLEEALGTDVPADVSAAVEEDATIEGVGEFEGFDPHDLEELPREPGIYVFYDVADHVIYVGQSGNVRDRIVREYVDKFWYHPRLINNASFVRVEDETLRLQIERTLIKFLKSNAVLNQHHVDR